MYCIGVRDAYLWMLFWTGGAARANYFDFRVCLSEPISEALYGKSPRLSTTPPRNEMKTQKLVYVSRTVAVNRQRSTSTVNDNGQRIHQLSSCACR